MTDMTTTVAPKNRRHRHLVRMGTAASRSEDGRWRLNVPRMARALFTLGDLMTTIGVGEAAKAVFRRNTEEVQGRGNFEVFEELFADDFLDHTPQPGRTPDKDGARQLYKILRTAFPDFHADIHWQLADGDRVTTYKTYKAPHRSENSIRDRRCHARAQRKNRRALGRGQSLLPHAAARRLAGRARSLLK